MINTIKAIPDRLDAIKKLKNKVAYNHFTEPQELPYAAYLVNRSSTGADDMHNLIQVNATIELYSENRDFALENEILKAFEDVEVDTMETYLDDEKMYMIEFTFTFFEKI